MQKIQHKVLQSECYAEYRQSYSICPICGNRFKHSPSDITTHTCGINECKAIWRSQLQSGRKMTNANEAIRKLPHTGHFETNHRAEEWILLSPEGNVYHFRNLHLWVEKNIELLPISKRTGKRVDLRTFEREIMRLKHTDLGTEKNSAIHDHYYGWKILKMEGN